MHTLRLAAESDDEFRIRAVRAGRIARALVEACLANRYVQEFIADPAMPEWTADNVRISPTVRVEYEQAIAIGDLGSCLSATKSKYWGAGKTFRSGDNGMLARGGGCGPICVECGRSGVGGRNRTTRQEKYLGFGGNVQDWGRLQSTALTRGLILARSFTARTNEFRKKACPGGWKTRKTVATERARV